MSYSKTVFFIPVWFDDFKRFSEQMAADARWTVTAAERIKPRYLFHYATNLATDGSLFQSYTLKDRSALNVYLYENEMPLKTPPVIEEVRFSCFATGVGFMEFWVSYTDMSVEEIADFAYLFKKATKPCGKELPNGARALYDVAQSLLPDKEAGQLFFAASARFKFECNCLHFIHVDGAIPDEAVVKDTLNHLCRSYKTTMSSNSESVYDMVYEAAAGDFWGGSTEGMVNIVYDPRNDENDPSYYYLHTIKLDHLSVDYQFLYLLLLNQKYAAVEYIDKVAKALGLNSKEMEKLNRRIIQLKNVFSFNVVSDDRHFQNVYAKMFKLLEIQSLLADVIENENQMEVLQNAKHAKDDRLSNKYLFGISVLTLFSALIDAAAYFDRFHPIRPLATPLSFVCVAAVFVGVVAWVIRSGRK